MAYGINEFPSTVMHEPKDMTDFIRLYNKVDGEYEGTLEEITSLKVRLSNYENSMNDRIESLSTKTIPSAVKAETDVRLSVLNNNVTNLSRKVDLSIDNTNAVANAIRGELKKTQQELTEFEEESRSRAKLDASTLKLYAEQQARDVAANANNEISSVRDLFIGMLAGAVTNINKRIDKLDASLTMEALRWIWDYGCNPRGYNAVTWSCDGSITCEAWNKSDVTCAEWYTNGKEVFDWYDRQRNMYSPVSGRIMSPECAIMELAQALKINGLMAGQYDNFEWTAGQYDEKGLDAQTYDWAGREMLYAHETD